MLKLVLIVTGIVTVEVGLTTFFFWLWWRKHVRIRSTAELDDHAQFNGENNS